MGNFFWCFTHQRGKSPVISGFKSAEITSPPSSKIVSVAAIDSTDDIKVSKLKFRFLQKEEFLLAL